MIVSCKVADQRSRASTVLGSTDFEDMAIGDVGGAVRSISFSIGRLAESITLFSSQRAVRHLKDLSIHVHR